MPTERSRVLLPDMFDPLTMSTVVGPEDLFEISVLGEKDLTHEFQVQPDGTHQNGPASAVVAGIPDTLEVKGDVDIAP